MLETVKDTEYPYRLRYSCLSLSPSCFCPPSPAGFSLPEVSMPRSQASLKRTAERGKQRVALNALLGNDKDEYRALACQQVGLAYRRVRAGKAHPGKAVCMSRLDLAPDSTFLPSWEMVDPNALGKQIVSYERGIFGEGDPRLVATRANGRPLADIR